MVFALSGEVRTGSAAEAQPTAKKTAAQESAVFMESENFMVWFPV